MGGGCATDREVHTIQKPRPPGHPRHNLEPLQELLLSSSASVLDSAVEAGYWDATISTPSLQLLDGVIGAYGGSSDAVVGSEEMGYDAATK